MRKQKSAAVSCRLTVLEVFVLLLCNTSSLTEGKSLTNPCNDLGSTTTDQKDVCLTPECIHTASIILKNMDPNVDPCEDFYRYACGGFINETILSDSQTSTSYFNLISNRMFAHLKSSIQADIEPNEPKHFRLMKSLYRICMNEDAIEAAELKPLFAQLDKMGGWPVVLGEAWNEDEFVWWKAIYKFRDAGYSHNTLIDFEVITDWKNSSQRLIFIDEGQTGLSKKYLSKGFDDKIVYAYYNFMVDIAVMLGANQHYAQKELEKSLTFEMRLADIMLSSEERRNATKLYNPMTLTALSNTYPSIPWKEYFNRLLPPSITIDNDEVVIVCVPSYFTNLEKLLSETPKRIQANFLMWMVVMDSIDYLNEAIRKRRQMFTTLFTGKTESLARSDKCTEIATWWFSVGTGAMYVKKYFNKEAKKSAADMVMEIKEQFNIILKKVDWMDEKTRLRALEKATAMISHVAYPEELLDDEKLEKIYEKLEMSGDNYLDSVLNLERFSFDYSLGKLREPMNKSDWINYAKSADVNAFYSPDDNSIQFPAGILQGIFFNKNRPNYMNYGSIGFIIGHEITHGFDDIGKQFDKNGNLVNWWEPSTEQDYFQRVQCIIEQYGKYTVPEVGLKLNGVNTQSENVADNGGIKIAYLAYNSWAATNKPEKKLPGLDMTTKQMFWLSAANVWCSKSKRETLRSNVILDPHSPDEFRVIGSFSNMQEFANDFNCPEGSRMNPKKKCSIW